jgi:hypothetical protein
MKDASKLIIFFVIGFFILLGVVKFQNKFCEETYKRFEEVYYTVKGAL